MNKIPFKNIEEECYGEDLSYGEEEGYREVLRGDIKWGIQQSYDKEYKMVDLMCTSCGSFEFNVGRGTYYTAIRCSKCGWEECLHDG